MTSISGGWIDIEGDVFDVAEVIFAVGAGRWGPAQGAHIITATHPSREFYLFDSEEQARLVRVIPDDQLYGPMTINDVSESLADELFQMKAWPTVAYEIFPHTARSVPIDPGGDLELINRHRARTGQRPLDPSAAGWLPEDVAAEAARIRSLNPRRLRRRLMRR